MAKQINYTDEQVALLKEGYTGTDNATEVKRLSVATGKSVPSVRAKLTSMGIYIPEKNGTAPEKPKITKCMLAEQIVARMPEFNDVDAEALQKTTVPVLTKILKRLTNDS